jgi:hypothetical protein
VLSNRFSPHSAHASLEKFQHLKQQTSVAEYIHRFEEMMVLKQIDYLGLTEPYFISSFIVGLKEGIKHYLIPHNPQTLCETYWKAKELEKGILVNKSFFQHHQHTPNHNLTSTQIFTQKHPIQCQPPLPENPHPRPAHNPPPNRCPFSLENLESDGVAKNLGPQSRNFLASLEEPSMQCQWTLKNALLWSRVWRRKTTSFCR